MNPFLRNQNVEVFTMTTPNYFQEIANELVTTGGLVFQSGEGRDRDLEFTPQKRAERSIESIADDLRFRTEQRNEIDANGGSPWVLLYHPDRQEPYPTAQRFGPDTEERKILWGAFNGGGRFHVVDYFVDVKPESQDGETIHSLDTRIGIYVPQRIRGVRFEEDGKTTPAQRTEAYIKRIIEDCLRDRGYANMDFALTHVPREEPIGDRQREGFVYIAGPKIEVGANYPMSIDSDLNRLVRAPDGHFAGVNRELQRSFGNQKA